MKKILIVILCLFVYPAFAAFESGDVCKFEKQRSQADYAWMYENGVCADQDLKRAFVLYKQAATMGDVSAQFALAMMYQRGRGTEQDSTEAYAWHMLALKNAHLQYERWMDEQVTLMKDEIKQAGEQRLQQLQQDVIQ